MPGPQGGIDARLATPPIHPEAQKTEMSQPNGCPVCGDSLQGFHYGIECCRSCASFFKRCFEKNLTFDRHPPPAPGEIAVVECDVRKNRNVCKQCRLQLCLDVGMQPSLVQGSRCPTGAQPNRKRKNSLPEVPYDEETAEIEERDEAFREMQMDCQRRQAEAWQTYCPLCEDGLCKEGLDHFIRLVEVFGHHFRMMQLEFVDVNTFLQETRADVELREFIPQDVGKLSEVERTGLLFWVEQMGHFKGLPEVDQKNLLNRYSVRKLSLDHFYSASKYPDYAKQRKFVMNNYTYVPPHKTGFESVNEDPRAQQTKRSIFSGTFDRFWANVIDRFIELQVGDADIVFIQHMLMWSPLNHLIVTNGTQAVLRSRRSWTVKMIFEYYEIMGFPDPEIRIGEMINLFQEIEIVVDMHCADIHVSMLFDFFGLQEFWYKDSCYAPVNLDRPLDNMDFPALHNSFSNLSTAMHTLAVEDPNAIVPSLLGLEKTFTAHGIDAETAMESVGWYSEEKRRLATGTAVAEESQKSKERTATVEKPPSTTHRKNFSIYPVVSLELSPLFPHNCPKNL